MTKYLFDNETDVFIFGQWFALKKMCFTERL